MGILNQYLNCNDHRIKRIACCHQQLHAGSRMVVDLLLCDSAEPLKVPDLHPPSHLAPYNVRSSVMSHDPLRLYKDEAWEGSGDQGVDDTVMDTQECRGPAGK